MGYIRIEIGGSFPSESRGQWQTSALDLGHAAAIGEAIEYLASLLPSAVDLDHRLHADGAHPAKGFGLPWDDGLRSRVAR